MNNSSAMMALGEMRKNQSSLDKQLKKVASGMKINSAGDGASEYSISEKMRVRLRALKQNADNVQTGCSLLHIAEGAIQEQIDIMKTIKQKVIDAHNDTNTSLDRKTIQKEIDQGYDQIDDIAYYTTYNGKRILDGKTVREAINSWSVRDAAEMWTDSADMNLIPDNYGPKANGDPEKYDTFLSYLRRTASISTLGLSASQTMSGGQDYQAQTSVLTVNAADIASLDKKGITVTVEDADGNAVDTDSFVFAYDTSVSYENNPTVINLNNYSTVSAALNALRSSIQSKVTGMSSVTVFTVLGNEITAVSSGNYTTSYTGYSSVDTSGNPNASSLSFTQNTTAGQQRKTASYTIAMPSAATNVETFISSLVYMSDGRVWDKAITVNNNRTYEFIDSGQSYNLYGAKKIDGSNTIDLNNLRIAVNNGTDIGTAFANLLKNYTGGTIETDGSGNVTGLTIYANVSGSAGNSRTVTVNEATLSSYDVNFSGSLDGVSDILEYLNEKGFHFYVNGSDNNWVEIQYSDGTDEQEMGARPASGTGSQTINTIIVDVSAVTDTKSLVNAIYSQAGSKITSAYKLAVKADNVLTIYDSRGYNVTPADIADGAFDNVQKDTLNVKAEKVVIQDTDKAGMSTNIYVPKTSTDHIFKFIPGSYDVRNYNVLTSEMREQLLGTGNTEGTLDKGINYLLDAQTLIGAQISRLEMDHKNITIQSENVQASESVLRDADMAKEMTNYAKANVLTQASQAMLAQANQNSSQVLSLLS
ncbi:flagellin [Selenomonas sp. FC4001]|uniref:flagellin N-terminal helical domain-containing protein n=1 Tax=Selenomonas sp. FC4001 TaxID=1408313 RepID=UPI001E299FAA|nr:flagellin [Selenomonas sp. FC4001]